MSPLRRVIDGYVYDGTELRPIGAGGAPGPDPQAPSVPTGLDAVPAQTSVLLTWQASTPGPGDGIDYYQLARNGTLIASPGGTSQNVTGLSAGTTYAFAVRAVSDRGLISPWSPELLVTTKPATPPPSGGTKFGFSTVRRGSENYQQAINRVSQLLGDPRMYRYFFGTSALSWPLTALGTWQNLPLVCSWKPYPAASVPGGQWDNQIRTWLAKLPTNRPTWFLCFDHELDVKLNDGTYTLAQGGAAWNHIAQVVKDFGNPNIRTTFLLTGFQSNTRYRQWRNVIDIDLVDVLGADPYAAGATTAAQALSRYNGLYDDILAAFPGKHVGIGETGVNSGTDAQRAAWISGAVQAIHNHAEVTEFASYFHSTVGGDFQLDNYPQAAAVWRAAVEAS